MKDVKKTLQRETTNKNDVRAIFHASIHRLPHTESKLSTTETTILNDPFESAVVKVHLGNSASLSREEITALLRFETSKNELPGNGDSSISYVDRALKRQWQMSLTAYEQYIDLRFLLPTSNICERFISISGHVFNDRCKRLLPSNLES